MASSAFSGGVAYDISGKTMREQADRLLSALGSWALRNPGRAVVWLNPSMQHVATLVQRSATLDWVEFRLDVAVKPPLYVYVEGVG